MKALKEKRISLRSLLRRSLVILSLLALVFASCGDSSSSSSGGEGGGSNYDGPPIVKVTLPDEITETQYLATPVNMNGLSATVYFADGTSVVDNNLTRFRCDPAIVFGQYVPGLDDPTAFKGMDNCRVTYFAVNGERYDKYLTLKDVVGIYRSPTQDDSVPDPLDPWASPTLADAWKLDPNYGSKAQGVQLTGITSSTRQRKVFVDTETFDFSGLALEANYYNGATKVINFNNVDWKILPDYDRRDPVTNVSPGYLYITVGKNNDSQNHANPLKNGFQGWTPEGSPISTLASMYADGITVIMPLDVVYTVDGIDFVEPPELPDYFFWMENSKEAWLDRLLLSILEIKYKGTSEVKRYSIAELVEKRPVWFNENINQTEAALGVLPLAYPFIKAKLKENYPKVTENNGAKIITPGAIPGITVYYRGFKTFVNVDVYSQFVRLDVVSADGGDLAFDKSSQDNDNYGTMGTEKGLMSRILVTATYRAYNDTALEKEVPLTWADTAAPGPLTYWTDFYTVSVTNAHANNNKTKKLTFNYQYPESAVITALNTAYGKKSTKGYVGGAIGNPKLIAPGTDPNTIPAVVQANEIFDGTLPTGGLIGKLNAGSINVAWSNLE